MTSYSKYKNLDNKLDTVIKSHDKILQILEELKEEVRNNRCRCASFEKRSETSKPTATAASARTPIANEDKKSGSFGKRGDPAKNPHAKSVATKLTPILKNGKPAIKSSGSAGRSKHSVKEYKGSSRTAEATPVRSGKANTGVKSPANESSNSGKMKTATIELPIDPSEENTSTDFIPAEYDLVWGEASPTPPPVTRKKVILKKRKSIPAKLSVSSKSNTKSNNSNQPGSGTKQVPQVKNTLKPRGSSSKRRRDEVRSFKSFKKRRDTRLGSKSVQREAAKGSLYL